MKRRRVIECGHFDRWVGLIKGIDGKCVDELVRKRVRKCSYFRREGNGHALGDSRLDVSHICPLSVKVQEYYGSRKHRRFMAKAMLPGETLAEDDWDLKSTVSDGQGRRNFLKSSE